MGAMFNFLDSKLAPKVHCGSPAMDNYEIDNLISPNFITKNRGFIAYTVIKPPVTIEFQLICSAEIAYINLNTTVGHQKCTGIEIMAKSSNSIYKSIGKAIYEENGIIFCDSKKYTKIKPPPGMDPNKKLVYFKSDTIGIYRNAIALKIIIFRTNRSVPCLGAVVIIGTPSRSCSRTTVETLEKLMGFQRRNTAEIETVQHKPSIPEDFKDALTDEIMTIPMTLPSGKTIDRETLEKHSQNEIGFGRKPCDPFTGVKFNDKLKPIMNVALKSRIDMFLLGNSENPALFGVARTTGQRLQAKSSNCAECAGEDCLYSIPCGHIFCRKCIVNLSVCRLCSCHFTKNQVKRFHSVQ